jgi:hypothetical protein
MNNNIFVLPKAHRDNVSVVEGQFDKEKYPQ